MTDVDVVIPSWNGWPLLDRCLSRLAGQTPTATVTVVDNGSTDATVDLVGEHHPGVRLVRLAANHGFAVAVNQGIAAGSAPFVVVLNNDVECDPEFVDRIVAPLRGRPGVGAVAGLLLVPGRATIDSYGLEIDRTLAPFARCAGAPHPATPLHEHGLLGPSGGAAAYRRAALDAVGTFDEGFFAYLEDADLALRLRAAGWGAAAAPDAVGVHLGSASFGPRSRWQVETAGASRLYLLRKYGVLRSGLGVALWVLATELLVVGVDLALERRLAAARGRWAGWRRGRGRRGPPVPDAVNRDIGFTQALLRRRGAIAARGRVGSGTA